MSCCSSAHSSSKQNSSKQNSGTAKKANCPKCGYDQRSVSYQTVLHHIVHPDNRSLNDQAYYFCDSAECSVIYFSNNDLVFTQDQVRESVGQKTTNSMRTVCYCFDVTAKQVIDELTTTGHSVSKEFVSAQTKAKNCACDIRNPSGRCCLVNFPKL
jgi:CopZ-like zinc binding protein